MTHWHAETVFCDDIRIENTGKHILIGVYGADLVPAILPAAFPIAIWIRFRGVQEGLRKFEMQLLDPADDTIGTLAGETEIITHDSATVLAMSGLPVEIKTPGDIVVKFAFDGGPPVEIGRLKVSAPGHHQPPPHPA